MIILWSSLKLQYIEIRSFPILIIFNIRDWITLNNTVTTKAVVSTKKNEIHTSIDSFIYFQSALSHFSFLIHSVLFWGFPGQYHARLSKAVTIQLAFVLFCFSFLSEAVSFNLSISHTLPVIPASWRHTGKQRTLQNTDREMEIHTDFF